MRILVTGVTRTGNLGGTAMLCAVEDVLRPHLSDWALASILPQRDGRQTGPDHARIVWADYRFWMLVVVPVCLLFWPVRRVPLFRWLLCRLPILRQTMTADAVIDLSGIAFVDGRGIPLLVYNTATTLPALTLGIPVYRLSQALGPFETSPNRKLAKWTLSRCSQVVARGTISLKHLHDLGISGSVHYPDTSFALEIPEEVETLADAVLTSALGDRAGRPLVLLSPSAVVQEHCRKSGVDMINVLTEAANVLHRRGVAVGLLPHSSNTGIAKNDDFAVVEELRSRLNARDVPVTLLDPRGDPRLARALIARADVFVAFRFHTLIAALSQAVPVATVGWSHKYAEAAAPFGMDLHTMDYSDLTETRLTDCIQELYNRKEELHAAMQVAAREAQSRARLGIEIVLDQAGERAAVQEGR